MTIGTTILMLTIGVYVVFNIINLRKNKTNDIWVLAKIIAENNQASLLFNDTQAAKESLYSLFANKDIEYVCILDKDDNIFSERNFTSKAVTVPIADRQSIGKKYNLVEVFYDIHFEGDRIGSLFIRSNLNQVNTQIKKAIIIGVVILVIAILLTYILANILRKIITDPILELASASVLISEQKDFSTKIEMDRTDELGTLVKSFNTMLGEIDKQNKELIESKVKTEQSSKAKEQFLANMSHEIRTPINGIYGMVKLLDATKLDNEQTEYTDAIKNSVDSLLVIINDILDFSKIEAGKLIIEKIAFSLKEHVQHTVKIVEHKAEQKNIRLSYHLDDDISEALIGDPVRINQIVMNLINNAIKFTNEGSVSLRCSLIEKTATHDTIKFEVEDTGIGIEEDKLPIIFESFSQEDESTTRNYGGTGLGLTISKQLVEIFGGNLNVKSKKGEGTTFYFTLQFPIGLAENLIKIEKHLIKEPESLEQKKVLLVEDNKINQFLALTILEKWKMEVTIADNGKIAIEKIKDQEFDVVLMDMQMPVMGGIEATQIIRKELKLDVPIIALTANAIKGIDKECLDAGMNDYISKPFNHSELFNKILGLINLKKETV